MHFILLIYFQFVRLLFFLWNFFITIVGIGINLISNKIIAGIVMNICITGENHIHKMCRTCQKVLTAGIIGFDIPIGYVIIFSFLFLLLEQLL